MKPVFTQDVESSVEHIVESEAFLNTLLVWHRWLHDTD
jgi:hypothetical protein